MSDKASLSQLISQRFKINERVLIGTLPVDRVNIAQRMRWASTRKTTRVEDVAYCLLGIFDINMPLLYGEGCKAFIRLQEEIIKRSNDHSIFTWIDRSASRSTYRSFYARSPAEFGFGSNMESLSMDSDPYAVTNKGLQITLPLQILDDEDLEYLAALDCKSSHSGKRISVRVRRISPRSKQFARVDPYRLYEIANYATMSVADIYVPEKVPVPLVPCFRFAGFKLIEEAPARDLDPLSYYRQAVWPRERRQVGDVIWLDPKDIQGNLFKVAILFRHEFGHQKIVLLLYNPLLNSTTTQFVMTDGSNVISSSGYGAAVGTPLDHFTLDGEVSFERVQWHGKDIRFSYVKMEMEIIGDAPMIIAHVRIDARDFWKDTVVAEQLLDSGN
jgi:hypothetical protein